MTAVIAPQTAIAGSSIAFAAGLDSRSTLGVLVKLDVTNTGSTAAEAE